MKSPDEPDPFRELLSDHLDGELEPAPREALERHLDGCAECRATLDDLRRLVAAARALPERAPEPDPWPGIARALAPATPRARPLVWPLALACAAGVLATLGLFAWRARGASSIEPRYLLLVHDSPELEAGLDEVAQAEIAARYARWAHSLGAHFLDGDELATGGYFLRPGVAPEAITSHAPIGGFFLLAGEEREILSLAAGSPHLERGGWLELRPIHAR
jgi:hypothetical protein